MGGPGSGTWYGRDTKTTTDSYRSLDVRQLQRLGVLRRGGSGLLTWNDDDRQVASIGWSTEAHTNGTAVTGLAINYTATPQGGVAATVRYTVPIDWTRCNYGNARPWFLCPAAGCGRRVALLYLGYRYFVCRHCNDLVYASQREDATDRARERLQALRVRLGGSPNLFTPFPRRPKRMHWTTYLRLRTQASRYEERYHAGFVRIMEQSARRITRTKPKATRQTAAG